MTGAEESIVRNGLAKFESARQSLREFYWSLPEERRADVLEAFPALREAIREA